MSIILDFFDLFLLLVLITRFPRFFWFFYLRIFQFSLSDPRDRLILIFVLKKIWSKSWFLQGPFIWIVNFCAIILVIPFLLLRCWRKLVGRLRLIILIVTISTERIVTVINFVNNTFLNRRIKNFWFLIWFLLWIVRRNLSITAKFVFLIIVKVYYRILIISLWRYRHSIETLLTNLV